MCTVRAKKEQRDKDLTKLFLIRHGETGWNAKKRYFGMTNTGLNAAGIKQAKELRKKYENAHIDRVYTSDRKRALEFARIIFPDREPEIMQDLREYDFGAFEGMTHAQLMKKQEKTYRKWITDPYNTTIPCAEAMDEFEKRVVRSIKRIVSGNRGKTVVVITHGGPICVIMNVLFKSKDVQTPPGGARLLKIGKGKAYYE